MRGGTDAPERRTGPHGRQRRFSLLHPLAPGAARYRLGRSRATGSPPVEARYFTKERCMSTVSSNEVLVDATLVRRLLAAQFPQWADLPVSAVPLSGMDNATFRLGADMSVRLPRY